MRERINGARINLNHISDAELEKLARIAEDRIEEAKEELRKINDAQTRRTEFDMTNTYKPQHNGAAMFALYMGLKGPPEDYS